MAARERVADAVLPEVVARRHLPAEAVASVSDGHGVRHVLERMHEDRHVELRPAERVGDGAFVSEVWERDQYAVDSVAMILEVIRAESGFLQALDRAVVRGGFGSDDRLDSVSLEHLQDCFPTGLTKMIRKEPPVADYYGERDASARLRRSFNVLRDGAIAPFMLGTRT
jgi:hypothetical protein